MFILVFLHRGITVRFSVLTPLGLSPSHKVGLFLTPLQSPADFGFLSVNDCPYRVGTEIQAPIFVHNHCGMHERVKVHEFITGGSGHGEWARDCSFKQVNRETQWQTSQSGYQGGRWISSSQQPTVIKLLHLFHFPLGGLHPDQHLVLQERRSARSEGAQLSDGPSSSQSSHDTLLDLCCRH